VTGQIDLVYRDPGRGRRWAFDCWYWTATHTESLPDGSSTSTESGSAATFHGARRAGERALRRLSTRRPETAVTLWVSDMGGQRR
jgi:hypothetical protein